MVEHLRWLFCFSLPLTFVVFLVQHVGAAETSHTIVVSPTGDDHASGTRAQPLRTISAAAEKAQPGDTVLVLAGTYRERVAPRRSGKPGQRIIYRAQPGKRVIIKGSELWQPNWHSEGDGVFSAIPDNELFNDRSPDYIDSHNPFEVALSSTPWERDGKPEVERGFGGDPEVVYTCGQVFINGQRLREVPYRNEVEKGHWFYSSKERRIYVGFGDQDPKHQQVEISTRRRIFAPTQRGLGYITVEGFIMEHCGNQYPTNFWERYRYGQRGALGIEAGHHWIIRRNVVRLAKTFGIDAGYVDRRTPQTMAITDNVIEENYVMDNGSAGILSNRSANMIVRNNVVTNNNTLRFFELKRWEQAGIKCHKFKNGHIHHNYIADNRLTYGVWLDNQFPDSRVSHNVIVNNGRAGLFLEMSDYDYDKLLVDHNVVVGNNENAVYIHDASGATFAHNLFANTTAGGLSSRRGQAIYIRQVTKRTRSRYHSFFNNLFIGNHYLLDVNYPAFHGGPLRFEGNDYDGDPQQPRFTINKLSDKPSPWTDEEFYDLVKKDVAGNQTQPEIQRDDRRVGLTQSQWRQFWKTHGMTNDFSSRLHKNSRVHYDEKRQKLIMDVSFDPAQPSSTDIEGLTEDFFGGDLGGAEKVSAGPFQNLKAGKNEFDIWRGLPILKPGELPPVNFNQM